MPGPAPVDALLRTSCGHRRLLDYELAVALAGMLNLPPSALTQEHFRSNIGLFRCRSCDARTAEFTENAAHGESENGGLNRTNRDRARQFAQRMYGKQDQEFERQYIDEGIGGTREDNKRARARLWGEVGSRGRG